MMHDCGFYLTTLYLGEERQRLIVRLSSCVMDSHSDGSSSTNISTATQLTARLHSDCGKSLAGHSITYYYRLSDLRWDTITRPTYITITESVNWIEHSTRTSMII